MLKSETVPLFKHKFEMKKQQRANINTLYRYDGKQNNSDGCYVL